MWRRGEGFLILQPIGSSFNYFFYFVYEVWTLTKQFFRTGSTTGNGPTWKFKWQQLLLSHVFSCGTVSHRNPTTRQSDNQKDTNVGNKARLPWSNLSSTVNGATSKKWALKASSSLWFTKNTQKTLSQTTNFVRYTDFQLWPWLMKGWIVLSFT